MKQWTYEEDETSTGQMFTVYNEHDKRITESYVTQEEAKLISTAPELAEALAGLLADIEGLEHEFDICAEISASSYAINARAALTKAGVKS